MQSFIISPIGTVCTNEENMCIKLNKEYAPALKELDGFSHAVILWWFSESDNEAARSTLTATSPYTNGPDTLGIFATRSPNRKNPIAVTVAQILSVDLENCKILISYIDAFDQTPVLDIKPYTPSLDCVANPSTPSWCSHWPKSLEESADFDWEKEFNF